VVKRRRTKKSQAIRLSNLKKLKKAKEKSKNQNKIWLSY
jgi:hypothetical protein